MTLLPLIARRTAIFVLVGLPGVAVVAWAGGGIFLERRSALFTAASDPAAQIDPARVAQFQKGALGPGENGRMDRNSVAVVDARSVAYRAWTAFWKTSDPMPQKDPTLHAIRLGAARIVFYPEPESADRPPTATDAAPGATILVGNEAVFRLQHGGRPSAHFEGRTSAVHRMAGGDSLSLFSDAINYTESVAAPGRPATRVIESDRTIRLDGGGAVVTGRGMRATLDLGRKQHVRIERDVEGRLHIPGDPKAADAAAGADATFRCDDAADIEALDAPSGGRSGGRQPWRVTLRGDCVLEDPTSTLKADEIILDFIRTGAADQKAGAPRAEVVRILATGHVEITGKNENAAYRVTCDRMRHFAEDGRTDVTILDGKQVLVLDSMTKEKRATTHTITANGPSTLRERRAAAERGSASQISIVCEGDVTAAERDGATGATLSELKAPRITMEGYRSPGTSGATRRPVTPTLLRGEGGAELRRQDLFARARTIAWATGASAARAGGGPANEHVALVGAPFLAYPEREGVNPFDAKGEGKPGSLELTAGERIDADIAPANAPNAATAGTAKRRSGAHAVTCTGGMTARKVVNGEATLLLTATRGSARLDDLGRPRELHAEGDAHLVGHGESGNARAGEFWGDDILIVRNAAGYTAADAEIAPRDMDAVIRTNAGPLALGVLVNGSRRHELRAREIRSLAGGAVIELLGDASVDFDLPVTGAAPLRAARTPGASIIALAQSLRVECDPGAAGNARIHAIRGNGAVVLRDAHYVFEGDQITYDRSTGRVAATGAPARLLRVDDPDFPSYLVGPAVNGELAPDATAGDAFRRGVTPRGGTLVVYKAGQAGVRERITIVSKGPFEVTRTFAAATDDVIVVFEKHLPNGSWHMDSRLDQCLRVDSTLDAEQSGRAAATIRTLLATGRTGPREGARITTQSPDRGRVAVAIAERIELSPGDQRFALSCPSGESRVFVDERSKGARYECDRATINYESHEWESERQTAVLE